MAWLEKRGQKFLLVFRLNGSRYKRLLDLMDRREADAVAAKVDRRIEMLERGEWQLPDPANVVDSLVEDLAPRPVVPLPTGKTLGALIDEYLPTVSTGSLESNSLGTLTTHLNHVRRVMGAGQRVEAITFASLQKYVDARSKAKGIVRADTPEALAYELLESHFYGSPHFPPAPIATDSTCRFRG